MKIDDKRRKARDSRALFVRGLPPMITQEQLKKLATDIDSVRHKRGSNFAFISFRTEAARNKASGELSKKVFNNRNVIVDLCGDEATCQSKRGVYKLLFPLNILLILCVSF